MKKSLLIFCVIGVFTGVGMLLSSDYVAAQDTATCNSFEDKFEEARLSNNWLISPDGDATRVVLKDGKLYLKDIDPGPLQALIDTKIITAENFTVSVDIEAYSASVTTEDAFGGMLAYN